MKIIAFVPTRDSAKARSFYEGCWDFVLSKMTGLQWCWTRMESWFELQKLRSQPGAVHDFGMASFGHRASGCGAPAKRGSLREIRLLRAGRVGNLDSSDWRQGGQVQRSRWECSLGFRTCLGKLEYSSGAIYYLRALCGSSQRSQRFKVFQYSSRKSQRSRRTAAECAEKPGRSKLALSL
jgi:hypothetical protein